MRLPRFAVLVMAFFSFPLVASAQSTPAPATPAAVPAQRPSIAVYGFSSRGLNPWWGGGSFDPGAALADLLTDRLVNAGSYNVVDREHIRQILGEQDLSREGQVESTTAAKLGRMLGANYLIVGRIVQLDKTADNGGAGGALVGALLGGAVHNQKVTLRVAAQVLEVNTGRIIESITSDHDETASSFAVAGLAFGGGAGGGGGYESQQFLSSAMGRLLTAGASDLVAKIDPSKLVAVVTPKIQGRIISVDGKSVVLNIGSSKGVAVGQYFSAFDVKHIKDPDSGHMIDSVIKRGSIEITSVENDSAVGRIVNGIVKNMQMVRSE